MTGIALSEGPGTGLLTLDRLIFTKNVETRRATDDPLERRAIELVKGGDHAW